MVAAGGVYNGRGLAAALCHGASAVWVGTRFVCAEEAGAPKGHKDAIINSTHEGIVKTILFVSLSSTAWRFDWSIFLLMF